MKRNVGPAKALAVILSASLALSPSITAAATSGDSVSDVIVIEDADDEAGAEATVDTDSAEDAVDDVVVDSDEEADDNATDEEKPLFEKVDPEEEGLGELSAAVDAEEPEIPVEEKDPDEQTRVIIVMEGDSVLDAGFDTENLAENDAAMNLSENIIAEQEETVEKISEEALDGEELDVNYNFSILTNAVSADVAYKDIENIVNVDGVVAVYVAQKYDPMATADPMTITSGDMVGSYSTWATGYTGAGTRIAIIDTGIDSDHPSFDAGAFRAHLDETAEAADKAIEEYDLLDAEEIAEVLPNLNVAQRSEGVTADQLFVNDKIAFAFNYVDKNLDITHDNDDEGDHGTHVSGIATANYYVPDASSETGYARQEMGVVGVAPDAQLITMKVFGTNGGAYSDDYMAAIEDALLLKADVVNLSLGSSAAGYSSDSEAYINEIFEKLEGTSTVVSISAGNSGRWADDSVLGVNLSSDVNQDTVGSPGSYTNALTVASAVNSGLTGNYFVVADGKKVFYADGSNSPAPLFETLDLTDDKSGTEYPFVFLNAKGEPADYEGVDVTDKIVFVQRGAITFGEKQMNAEAAGAKAVVIYNNQPGRISMTLQGSTAVIPAVSITLADGLAIAQDAEQISENVYEGTLTVTRQLGINTDVPDAYTMSTFSSFGVPGTLDLKPEITAPGGNIYSTTDNGTYGLMSGTSMAAPSISGQSALVEQYIRENGLADLSGLSVRTLAQSLLMSTAVPLHEENNQENPEFTPRSQGSGLANVYNAVTSPSYILVGDKEGNDGKVKVTLGDDPERKGNYSFSFDVYNMTSDTQYYVLDSSVLTEELYADEESGLTYFAGNAHRLNPAVTLTADDTALVYDLNEDGVVNTKDKKLFLKAVNGSVKLSVIESQQDYFDFNKDGAVNTKDVYIFAKQLKGGKKVVDLGLRVVQVVDKTTIDVNINLSEADRSYLAGFENGMYVDGFIYVNGIVDLSVPFLAFYGSWMDSSMYEPYDFMEAVHNPEYTGFTYSGLAKTNFLSIYPMGSKNENYYIPNLFADDDKYVADRNAISSENGSALGAQYYSLIRNANRVILTIKDKNTGDVYYDHTEYENYASFVYNGNWTNYMQYLDLDWAATDAEGNPLPDGTEFEVVLEAVPSYYDDVEDASTLTGKGLYLRTPMVVDNTSPIISDAVKNEDGKYEITVYDNRYTAAVLVLSRDGDILGRYAVNQETKDEDVVITVDAPEDVFYVEVFDYACNGSVYRFNNTGHADTKYVTELTVDKEELELQVGRTATITATVGPKWLAEGYDEVEWSSSDMSIAYVTQTGTVLGRAAGEAVITVTTLATDKRGKHLTAEVKVTVKERTSSTDDADEVESNEADLTDDADADESVEEAEDEIVFIIGEEASSEADANELVLGGENDD